MASVTTTDERSPSERITRAVRSLAAAHSLKQKDLASHIGITLTQLRRRLDNKATWTVDEVDALARYFEQPADVFFLPHDEFMARIRSWKFRALPDHDDPRVPLFEVDGTPYNAAPLLKASA